MDSNGENETPDSTLEFLPIHPNDVDWKDAPLEYVVTVENNQQLLHDMNDAQVLEYTRRCQTLRASHHTMGATLKKEAEALGHKKEKKPSKKDDIGAALKALGLA